MFSDDIQGTQSYYKSERLKEGMQLTALLAAHRKCLQAIKSGKNDEARTLYTDIFNVEMSHDDSKIKQHSRMVGELKSAMTRAGIAIPDVSGPRYLTGY